MTPSLEGWPTKAKEAPSPCEVRPALLNTNPRGLLVDNNEHKKAEGMNKDVAATIGHNEYKDALLTNTCLSHSMKEFKVSTRQ